MQDQRLRGWCWPHETKQVQQVRAWRWLLPSMAKATPAERGPLAGQQKDYSQGEQGQTYSSSIWAGWHSSRNQLSYQSPSSHPLPQCSGPWRTSVGSSGECMTLLLDISTATCLGDVSAHTTATPSSAALRWPPDFWMKFSSVQESPLR